MRRGAQKELVFPATLDDGRLDTIIKVFAVLKEPKQILRLNWRRVRRISPAGYALLACLFDSATEQKCRLENVFIPQRLKSFPVVANLLKIKQDSALPLPSLHDYCDESFLVRGHSASIDLGFFEIIRHKFSNELSEDLLFSCQLIHNELMQNSVDHAGAERYYSYAGIVGNSFHMGVLDMGISIPAKLEQKYAYADDVEALSLALKLGVSTRRIRAGGLGLNHTFELLKENQGRLTIVSRKAQIRRYFKRRKTAKGPLKHKVNGTWCFTRFRLGDNP